MKIEKPGQDYGNRIQPEGASRIDESRNRANAAASQRTQARDQATVSDRARLLSQARTEFDRTAATNSERVNSLRSQVAAGTYRVSYTSLAARLAGQVHGPMAAG
jgi:flagellar biosynthesis anti-sigma factor FlgM